MYVRIDGAKPLTGRAEAVALQKRKPTTSVGKFGVRDYGKDHVKIFFEQHLVSHILCTVLGMTITPLVLFLFTPCF